MESGSVKKRQERGRRKKRRARSRPPPLAPTPQLTLQGPMLGTPARKVDRASSACERSCADCVWRGGAGAKTACELRGGRSDGGERAGTPKAPRRSAAPNRTPSLISSVVGPATCTAARRRSPPRPGRASPLCVRRSLSLSRKSGAARLFFLRERLALALALNSFFPWV